MARAGRILSVFLLLLGPALALHHGRSDSATADEPHHLLAGYQMVRLGDYALNLEHPPLAKDPAGLALLVSSPRPIGESWKRLPYLGNLFEAFLYGNRVPSSRILLDARLPYPLFLLALEFVVYLLVRRFARGDLALPAALVVGLEPNFVAHAAYVHSDVPAAFAFAASVAAWLAFLRSGRLATAAAAGAVLGLALATKFSAVLLVPMLAVTTLVWLLREARGPAASPTPGRAAAGFALALGIAAAAVPALYAVHMRGMKPESREEVVRHHLAVRGAPPGLLDRIDRLARVSPPLAHYAAGLAGISLQSERGQGVNFLEGKLSRSGWWSYFPKAFLYKTPLALVLLVAAGAVLSAGAFRSSAVPVALVLGSVLFVLAALPSAYNIGVRHLLPVVPLLVVAAAAAFAIRLPRAAPPLLWTVVIFVFGATLQSHPQELGAFSSVAGGAAAGRDLLSDSNVDWGQDLWRLREWARSRGERLSVAYFGGATVRYEMPEARDLRAEAADAPIPEGLFAVSEFLLRAGPTLYLLSAGDPEAAVYTARLLAAVRDRGTLIHRAGVSLPVFRLGPERRPLGAVREP